MNFKWIIKLPLFEFQSSRRVLESDSIVSGISFCNSLLVVKSNNKFQKIAVKFAQLDNLPNPFFAYENFSICILKFLHGPMSSKPKSTVGKYSNRDDGARRAPLVNLSHYFFWTLSPPTRFFESLLFTFIIRKITFIIREIGFYYTKWNGVLQRT